jgi:hypothetical protein
VALCTRVSRDSGERMLQRCKAPTMLCRARFSALLSGMLSSYMMNACGIASSQNFHHPEPMGQATAESIIPPPRPAGRLRKAIRDAVQGPRINATAAVSLIVCCKPLIPTSHLRTSTHTPSSGGHPQCCARNPCTECCTVEFR